MPSGFVVTNGSKILSFSSPTTPGPESATKISIDRVLLRRASTVIHLCSRWRDHDNADAVQSADKT